jgi:16S rRNA (guanine527-N7)-methyltransferase
VDFQHELEDLLPRDLPHRDNVVRKSAHHLARIDEANQHFNLTRITDPREAAIKHVLDSVLPWPHFGGAKRIVDAGSGAGFPGIPLALVMPHVEFILAEPIGKKARFLEATVEALDLDNVRVENRRVEELLRTLRADLVIARAVAPLHRATGLLGPALKQSGHAILYKGPEPEVEIAEAAADLKKWKLRASVLDRYSLPEGLGSRSLIELRGLSPDGTAKQSVR